MKKIFSIFLVTVMIITSSTTAFAANPNDEVSVNKSDRIAIGGYEYEVIEESSTIIVNEYDNDVLISTTTNVLESDIITKVNYNNEDDSVVESTYDKEDLIIEQSLVQTDGTQELSVIVPMATWTTYGKYNLELKNLSGQTKTHYALLYYYNDYTDAESYTISAAYHAQVSVLISYLASFLLGLFTGGSGIAAAVFSAAMSTAGSYAIDGIVQLAFSEKVSANVTHTITKYTDTAGGGTGSTFPGKRVRVNTRNSTYYDKTFYEGDAPERYSSNAYKACLNSYTGDSSYSYNRMVSFNAY